MVENIQSILDRLWSDYTGMNPQTARIHRLLTDHGDRVVHDHVALRTFRHPKLGIEATARLFEEHGYTARDEYECDDRKLYARWYENARPGLPKILISELKLEELSRGLRDIIGSMTRQIDVDALPADALVLGGCPWHLILHDTYERLRSESSYAAWVAALGFRASHFTVLVNELDSFDSLTALNGFLRENGFALNDAGGEIKGSPEEGLEQSATAPAPCRIRFADASEEVPGSHYQFARRHALPSGELFPGFLADCADWIFETLDPGTTPQPGGT